MKKFKVTWYSGSIEEIKTVIDEKIIKAKTIDDISINTILPEDVVKRIGYTRGILFSDQKHVYDYGSYTQFVQVEEIVKGKK